MRYDAIGLIRNGAESLRKSGDTGTAYALHELANNLLLVLQGKETMEAFKECYAGERNQPLDLDKHMPGLED